MQIEIDVDGVALRAERVVPEGGPHPGVIVIHDGRGFSEHAVGVAEELAQKGFAALAIDLFSRERPDESTSGHNEKLKAYLRALPDQQLIGDMQAAVDQLAADPAVAGRPVGLIGYCWGGSCGFLASAHVRGLSAVVSWYGELRTEELGPLHPEHPEDALARRRCPVLAMFAEGDAYVPVAEAEALRERAEREREAATPPLEVVIYPGLHHGFAHRGRPRFDAAGHDDGWRRIDRLFADTLRAGDPPADA